MEGTEESSRADSREPALSLPKGRLSPHSFSQDLVRLTFRRCWIDRRTVMRKFEVSARWEQISPECGDAHNPHDDRPQGEEQPSSVE